MLDRKTFARYFVLCTIIINAVSAQVWAHHEHAERELTLQFEPKNTVGLLLYRVPQHQARMLRVMSDLNKDGSLDERESKLLGLTLLGQGLSGVQVGADAYDVVDTKVNVLRDAVEVSALLTWPRRSVVRVSLAERTGALRVLGHVAKGVRFEERYPFPILLESMQAIELKTRALE